MEYTTNYKLKKPGDQDNVLVGDLNENMDTMDATMKELSDGKANLDPDTGKVEESELPEFLKLIGGTMKGSINMAGFPVSGLVDPVAGDHAARKAYIDALVATKAQLKTGSYVGNGQSTVTVAIGFYPKVVVFWAPDAGYDAPLTFSLAVYAGQSQDQIYNTGATELITRTYSVSGTNLVVSTINYPASFALNEQGQVYKFFALG